MGWHAKGLRRPAVGESGGKHHRGSKEGHAATERPQGKSRPHILNAAPSRGKFYSWKRPLKQLLNLDQCSATGDRACLCAKRAYGWESWPPASVFILTAAPCQLLSVPFPQSSVDHIPPAWGPALGVVPSPFPNPGKFLGPLGYPTRAWGL